MKFRPPRTSKPPQLFTACRYRLDLHFSLWSYVEFLHGLKVIMIFVFRGVFAKLPYMKKYGLEKWKKRGIYSVVIIYFNSIWRLTLTNDFYFVPIAISNIVYSMLRSHTNSVRVAIWRHSVFWRYGPIETCFVEIRARLLKWRSFTSRRSIYIAFYFAALTK